MAKTPCNRAVRRTVAKAWLWSFDSSLPLFETKVRKITVLGIGFGQMATIGTKGVSDRSLSSSCWILGSASCPFLSWYDCHTVVPTDAKTNPDFKTNLTKRTESLKRLLWRFFCLFMAAFQPQTDCQEEPFVIQTDIFQFVVKIANKDGGFQFIWMNAISCVSPRRRLVRTANETIQNSETAKAAGTAENEG